MDAANLAATWVSAFVTTIGLVSIVTQVGTIKAQLDPFYRLRGEDHIAHWGVPKVSRIWHTLPKPAPLGPILDADINQCLGMDKLYLSRRPITKTGEATWTILLAVFHPHSHRHLSNEKRSKSMTLGEKFADIGDILTPSKPLPASLLTDEANALPWHQRLEASPLIVHRDVACTTITRLTLIALVLLSQARETSRLNGPSGLRLTFASYNGFYQIEWALGQRPTLAFQPHESFQGDTDAFPVCFARRPRKCIEMACGVIDRGLNLSDRPSKVGFAGRKKCGKFLLKFLPRRFGAQRSAAGLYNEFGGKAYQVDFLFRERLDCHAPAPPHIRQLEVPSLDEGEPSTIYLQSQEVVVIADCLDHLAFSPLAWSIHRGMRDVLVAYALPYMMAYRQPLANTLTLAVARYTFALRARGWQAEFISECMAEQIGSAIMGDERCSGDACRSVTAVTELLWERPESEMDHTLFWKNNREHQYKHQTQGTLPADTVVALVKAYMVWWSHDFDYEIQATLPRKLYLT